MDNNQSHLSHDYAPKSPPATPPGGMLIQQYVQAARQRLEAINASTPAENATAQPNHPGPDQQDNVPAHAISEYAKNPSSSTQWPLRSQVHEQHFQNPQAQPLSSQVAKPHSSKLPIRSPRGGHPSHDPTRTHGRTENPANSTSAPRGPPNVKRGTSALRGYRGRHPPGPPRVPPPPRRPYYPPPNVEAQQQPSRFAAPSQQPPNLAPPVINRPSSAQMAPAQYIPSIEEEAENRKSGHSSMMTGHTLDILSEYSDETNSDVRYSASAANSSDPTLPSTSGTGIVRKASLGHVQKPVITNIPAAADRDTYTAELPLAPVSPVETSPVEPNAILESQVFASSAPLEARLSPGRASPSPYTQKGFSISPKRSRSPLMSMGSGSNSQTSPKPALSRQGSRELLAQAGAASPSPPADSGFSSSTQIPSSSPNAGGVRDSTTSLRGLIVRNLRLASNLEQGKTSSKFGIDWIFNNPESGGAKRASAGSISSIINTFPTTPRAEKSRSIVGDELLIPRVKGQDYAPHGTQVKEQRFENAEESPARQQPRKQCCWMPVWLFTILMIVVVLLIAAAIIIPIALIVIPNQNQSTSPSPTGIPSHVPEQCSRSLQCNNGGSPQSSTSGACYCLCVSPWTGPTCSTSDSRSCVPIETRSEPKAAIGSSIAPVIANSRAAFDIHLNASTLIGIFGSANLSCSSENALVSFNALGSSDPPALRNRGLADGYDKNDDDIKAALPTMVYARQATTNGIVYAPSTTMSTSTSASTTAPATSETTPVSSVQSATQALNFARAATLYLLQFTNELPVAQLAHVKLQEYFNTSIPAGTVYSDNDVPLGHGWRADFTSRSVYYNDS